MSCSFLTWQDSPQLQSEPGTELLTVVATAPIMPSPGGSVLARAMIMCTPVVQVVFPAVELFALFTTLYLSLSPGRANETLIRLSQQLRMV